MKILRNEEISKIIADNANEYAANKEEIYNVVKESSSARDLSYKIATCTTKLSVAMTVLSAAAIISNSLFQTNIIENGAIYVLLSSILLSVIMSSYAIYINIIFKSKINFELAVADSVIKNRIVGEIRIKEMEHLLARTDGTQLGMFNYITINKVEFFSEENGFSSYV
ncbi:TPA: hypothetical protein ACKTGI_002755 [Pseudomonas aeruginosa]